MRKAIGLFIIVALVMGAFIPVNAVAAESSITQDSPIDKVSDWAATVGKDPQERQAILAKRKTARAAKKAQKAAARKKKQAEKEAKKAKKKANKQMKGLKKGWGK